MDSSELEYVGFWARAGASLIDAILQVMISVPLLVMFYGWGFFETSEGVVKGPADFLVSYVLPVFLVVWFWRRFAATPGKMAVSARIVDAETGEAMSFGQSVGRYFAYIVSTIPLGLGFVWVAFDKRKQGWHDKLAGTVVVREKNRQPAAVEFRK